ncbi:metal/formaldehyde-sensitive transcriptional repressor [Roseococcus sp. YIM B11640]|uniref:metal/formaldehyde-sensitive transcriptional repressor n=1 Tax=Roseococcus sp. YIM B11640 TaxID=3133973 RepID=UPI003C7A5FC1
MAHLTCHRDPLLARVRRIAGQVAALEKAIAGDVGCAEVLHQAAGVRGAIAGLMDELIEDHLREHVARPGLTDEERAAAAKELAAVIRRYGK